MPTYAIGDIQGCYDELRELLNLIGFNPNHDRLWFTGDLVNRGPKSLQVLRYVRSLGNAAITVLGNHDLHLLALAYSEHKPLKSFDTLNETLTAPDRDELLHWLRHQPLLHYDATLRCALIHAGLPPQWDLAMAQGCARELENTLRDTASMRELFAHMYGDKPSRWSDDLRGIARLRFITNCFTRLRVCDRDGRLHLKYKGTLANIPKGNMPWFRVPSRQSTDIRFVFGHWSALGYHNGDGVLALDTGCVWGNRLCAVRIDVDDIGKALPICVPSRQAISLGD
jgi:bis(5'-nucleosyl)-tetraphosphatase (symmetrical)